MLRFLWVVLVVLLATPGLAKIVDRLASQFQETLHWGGMEFSLSLQFSPGSSHVFVAEKNGRIRMYDSIDKQAGDFAYILDLSAQTYIFHDRGMLGLAVHPQFPKVPFLYAMYSVNLADDGVTPLYTPPNQCPTIRDGYCNTPGRLIRIKVDINAKKAAVDQILISDFCGSSPSHHVDDLKFASDGSLYISVGDGALFDRVDIGPEGKDLCRDPSRPGPQGAFRAQFDDNLMGKIIRILPESLLVNRPIKLGTDFAIVAKGVRNPYRMTVRPDNGDIWFGDVGSDFVEEVNIVPNPLTKNPSTPTPNYGWPCMEGPEPMPGFAALNLQLCKDLPLASLTPPQYSYRHRVPLPGVPESEASLCDAPEASPTGLLFYTGYPAAWKNTMFLVEGSKRCVFYFERQNGTSGEPDMTKLRTFMYNPDVLPTGQKEGQYVDIQQGPNGEIYVIDIYFGKVFKITYIGAGAQVQKATESQAHSYHLFSVAVALVASIAFFALQ